MKRIDISAKYLCLFKNTPIKGTRVNEQVLIAVEALSSLLQL